MRIVCNQSALSQALAPLKRVIREQSDQPVLSHILLQVEGGRVNLSANNLELALTCELVASSTSEGAVAVPWERLQDLVEHLPTGEAEHRGKTRGATIEMEAPEGSCTLTVRSGRSRAVVYGMPASEFPVIPVPGPNAARDGLILALPAGLLAGMVHKVAFAASTDERNPILTGVLLHADGRSLTITARDAYRLSACVALLEEAVPRKCAAVIPAGAAAECVHILASARPDARVQLVIEEQRMQIAFLLPGLLLTTRLLTGNYPMGFREHVKPGYLSRVVVETKGFAAALRSLAQVAAGGGDLVTFSFATAAARSGRVVTVAAGSQNLGEQSEEITVVSLEGEPDDRLLRFTQVAQILVVLDAPYLALEMRGLADPLVVRPVGGDHGARESSRVQEAYVLVPCVRKNERKGEANEINV